MRIARGGVSRALKHGSADWHSRTFLPARCRAEHAETEVLVLRAQERLTARGSKVKVAACAPGLAATNLQKTTVDRGKGGAGLGLFMGLLMRSAQSAPDGAMPLLHCMLASDLKPGSLVVPGVKGVLGSMMGDGVRGPPTYIEPEPLCKVPASAALLWEKSEAAVGEPFFP